MEVIKLAQAESGARLTEPVKVVEIPQKPKETRKGTKSKEMPPLPPLPAFKSKITTHTRTEQESLAPVLPLRGGSGTVTMESKTITAKKGLPVTLNRDDSSQILDSGAKPPSHAGWFLMIWSLVHSWLVELGQDIKEVVLLLWAAIILRLPFYNQSKVSRGQVKKSSRQFRTRSHYSPGSKSDGNDSKMRK